MDFIEKYDKFIIEFEECIKNYSKERFVFLCIGTDRATGDCFGPFVGSILKSKLCGNAKVLGDLDNTISYQKLKKLKLPNTNVIIAIDAALSDKKNIGSIFVSNQGVCFGQSLNKKQQTIGNVSIRGVVGANQKDETDNFILLQNISLNKVMKMANLVATGIIDVMNKKNQSGKNIYIR